MRLPPHKPTTREEELDLIKRAKAGDKKARDFLVTNNLRLVARIALPYSDKDDIDDLIQDATFGLLRAIDKFDASKGTRFVTLAGWWCKVAIRDGAIARDQMTDSKWHERNEADIEPLQNVLPAPFEDPLERIADEHDRDKLSQALKRLKLRPEEVTVLLRRTFGSDTLQAIGTDLGMTREAVRQIEVKVRRRIEAAMTRISGDERVDSLKRRLSWGGLPLGSFGAGANAA